MKIIWYKHNLMISSSVGSGHPGKYSLEIPHKCLPGWGNLSGKIISITTIISLIRDISFQMTISLLPYVATSSEQFYFWRSNFFTLFQSNYFDTTVTFSGQLLLQSSCFFEELFFQNNHFFRSNSYFQSQTSSEQSLFENRKFFRTVTFQNSYLFDGGIV